MRSIFPMGWQALVSFIVLSGCQPDRQNFNTGNLLNDSTAITTLGQEEKASWEYYQGIEAELRKDGTLDRARIEKLIQAMIDDGSILQPQIFLDTDSGTVAKVVDYKTYKQYREDHSIDTTRNYVVTIRLPDTLARDSIRLNIRKALNADTLQ